MDYRTVVITGNTTAVIRRDRISLEPRWAVAMRHASGLFAVVEGSNGDPSGPRESVVIVDDIPGRDGAEVMLAFTNMCRELATAGWNTPAAATTRSTGWGTWSREDRENGHTNRIHFGILALMDSSRTPLFNFTDDAERIARNLRAFEAITGVVWRQTAGVSGCAAIRRIHADSVAVRKSQASLHGRPALRIGEPMWRWDDMPSNLNGAGDLQMIQDVSSIMGPRSTGYVTHLDIRSMYLAAMGQAQLSYSLPRNHIEPFDARSAGYWKIWLEPSQVPAYSRPWVLDYMDAAEHELWVTTPVMAYLNGQGINPPVIDAWVSPSSSRLLRPFAERITSQAAVHLPHEHPSVSKAWKRTYTETIGMFSAPGGSIHRPDWRDQIIDTARVNMIRKLDAAYRVDGMWPFKIYTDGVWYLHPEPTLSTDMLTALGAIEPNGRPDPRPGKFRIVTTTPASLYYAHAAAAGDL